MRAWDVAEEGGMAVASRALVVDHFHCLTCFSQPFFLPYYITGVTPVWKMYTVITVYVCRCLQVSCFSCLSSVSSSIPLWPAWLTACERSSYLCLPPVIFLFWFNALCVCVFCESRPPFEIGHIFPLNSVWIITASSELPGMRVSVTPEGNLWMSKPFHFCLLFETRWSFWSTDDRLYSTILHSWADSLRSHVVLHEWLAW